MDETLVAGDYTALLDLKIRTQMDTQSVTNIVGTYMRGVPFTVYEVYPERNGIVWGRVSSNTGNGTSRFVGLRVTNQLKAHLEKAFEQTTKMDLTDVLMMLRVSVDGLTDAVRELANQS